MYVKWFEKRKYHLLCLRTNGKSQHGKPADLQQAAYASGSGKIYLISLLPKYF
jgi:hypothetical protein